MLDKITKGIGNFCFRFKYIICLAFAFLFIASAIIQNYANISYSYADYNKVTDIFPEEDTLLIVYDNQDEDKIADITNNLLSDSHVTSILTYQNTLGMKLSAVDMTNMLQIDASFINALYYLYINSPSNDKLTVISFINFINSNDFLNNSLIKDALSIENKAMIATYATLINNIANGYEFNASELAVLLQTNVTMIEQIFTMCHKEKMKLEEFVDYIKNSSFINFLTAEQKKQLAQFDNLCVFVKSNEEVTSTQLSELFGSESLFNSSTISLLYGLYFGNIVPSNIEIPLYDFMMFLVHNEGIYNFLSDEIKTILNDTKNTLQNSKAQFIGDKHSRMIISINYELESKEINNFYKELNVLLTENFQNNYYLVGNSAMSYELGQSFKTEYLIIRLIIVLAIFLVVCISFKKILIPLFLVAIIECAVFITMSAMAITNFSIYFLALLIVQAILMGAMVDYGILLTSDYQESRKNYEKDKVLPISLKKSIMSILTSSSIMFVITFILGSVMEGAVASILKTLAVGILSATILVLFVLPSLLVIFDKNIIKKDKKV